MDRPCSTNAFHQHVDQEVQGRNIIPIPREEKPDQVSNAWLKLSLFWMQERVREV